MVVSYSTDVNLFLDGYLSEEFDRRWLLAQELFARIGAERALRGDLDELVGELVRRSNIEPVVLKRDEMDLVGPEDDEIDVSGEPGYGGSLRRGPLMVAAYKLVFRVPFEGDPALFMFRPRSAHMVPKYATVSEARRGQTARLLFTRIVPKQNAKQDEIKTEVLRTLGNIELDLSNCNEEAAAFNASLPARVRQLVEAHRKSHGDGNDFGAGFGLPRATR